MLQLCFGDSVKGSLTCAPHIGNTIGGATAVVLSSAKPLETPLQKAAFAVYRTLTAPFYKHRAQKEQARRCAEAVPVDYEPNDVLALLGGLNEGPVAGDLMSDARKEFVRTWLCFSPHGDAPASEADAEHYWQACQTDLQALLTRSAAGEPLRIWCDFTPGSRCGLHAAAALLEDAPCEITVVEPPELETNGSVTRRAALGERGPYEMGALLKYERPLPAADRQALAARWHTLQAENAPLRAVVDGQLCSVPADFYDTAILAKVPAGSFLTAQLIGKVLSECNLGIGDQLIYRRIEHLVKAGKLTQVTQGSGPYEAILHLP